MAQALALAAAAFFAAFPVRAFLGAPEVPIAAKVAWLLLLAIGMRPVWRARVVVSAIPFLPWLPFAFVGLPHGVVHLVVISQALPWLVHRGFRRRAAPVDAIGWLWLLLLLAAATAAVPYYAAFALRFDGMRPFLTDLASQLDRYVFLRPGIDFANIIVAVTAFLDGVLAWLIVRTSPDSTLRLAQIAATSAVGVAAAGVWQAFTGVGLRLEWRLNDPYITRVNGTFSDPNALAAFLASMVPVVASLGGRAAGRLRGVWLAGAALAGSALVLTAGRVGVLGALAGVAVMAAAAIGCGLDRHDPAPVVRRYFRKTVVAAFALVLVGACVLVAAGTALDARHHQQQSHLDTWLYTFNLRGPVEETSKGRLGIWRTAAHIVRDHPLFGVGPGRIFRIFPGYSQDVPDAPQGIALSAHDTFLNIAAELGLVGLLAWLALLGATMHAAWRGAGPGSGDAGHGGPWLGVGLLGAWCACLVTMTTGDRTILREDVVTLGVLSALVARRSAAAAPSAGFRGACVVAAVALVVATPFRMRAEQLDVRLDRVTVGLHAIERAPDGTMFRWTTGRAVFHLPPSATIVTLRVRALAPFPQKVRVLVEDAPVADQTLIDHAWRPTRIALARSRTGYHRIEVLVSPTWTPPNDGRELGVMLVWEGR